MSTPVDTLAQFVSRTQLSDIPSAVQQHAKLVLLDTVGVMLAGFEQPEMQALQKTFATTAGQGATVLCRGWPVNDPRTAALLNGTAGRSIELCEGHRFVACQAGVQVLPGLLASAEVLGRSGAELLSSLVLGYDVAVRMGYALTPRALAHQNGQSAMIGAAAGGARLRNLTPAQMSQAMRIAATFVLTPSYTNAVAGATTLNAAGGMCGFTASLAPEMAQAGFIAQEQAIGEAFAHLVGDGYQESKLLEELGTRFEITRNYFRLRACCNPIYASLDAFEEAWAQAQVKVDQIERVDVYTYRFASNMQSQTPRNGFASKYSLPHTVAAIALRGNAGYGSFTETFVQQPEVVALRQRVFVQEDPALNAQFPTLKPSRVTLTFKNGQQITKTCESAKGDFQRPYQESEIREKFHELAGLVLTSQGVTALESAIDRVEQWTSLDSLTSVLRQHSRLNTRS